MSFTRQMKRKDEKMQQKKSIDYQLHKAQQLEMLNQTLDMLKNNVYGQSQVDIVLYALSEGMSKEDAIDYSLDLIDTMNQKNADRIQKQRDEFEAKKKAAMEQQQAQQTDTAPNLDGATDGHVPTP